MLQVSSFSSTRLSLLSHNTSPIFSVRVKSGENGAPESFYAELRMPSSSANAYLVIAGMIGAGEEYYRAI